MSVYLDYNATAPLDPRVLDTMIDVYRRHPGNPDSRTHEYGEQTRKITEHARKQVAMLLGVTPEEVFFTAGSTESNNIAIQGLRAYAERTGKKHIVTTAIEHKAVLNTVQYLGQHGFTVDLIKPDRTGCVSAQQVVDQVREDTLRVSVMHVNNETGAIQPVNEIGAALAKRNILFHIDATQSCGKLVDEVRALPYDMLAFSAHKFGGPQGIGGLILRRKKYKLPPVSNAYFGGQQEHGLRPGTTPVALVAVMGKACELAMQEYKANAKKCMRIKASLLQLLKSSGVRYKINGVEASCIDSTLNVCFPGVSSEALMIAAKQYCAISYGSACNSHSYAPSYVLLAMGVSKEEVEDSVRISYGATTQLAEVEEGFKSLLRIVKGFSGQ